MNEPDRKSGVNWWLIGGLAFALALALGIVGLVVGAKAWASNTVERYTAVGPAKLPALTTTDADWRALQRRLGQFKRLVDAGEPAQLELTGEDLNTIIRRSPKHGEFKDLVWLNIDGDQIIGRVSVPLKNVETPMLKGMLEGRWLNGEATFYLGLSNGKASLHMNDLKVNDLPIPARFKARFGKQNLLEKSYEDPEFRRLVGQFESITVADGKLKIAVKPDALTKENEKNLERNRLDAPVE